MSSMYCQVVPPKKMVEVESIVITIDDEEFVFDKDEAVELRDLLLSVFPKERSDSWTITTSPDTTTTWISGISSKPLLYGTDVGNIK